MNDFFHHRFQHPRRSGFTMVEVLVVIGIIAVLVGLSLAVAFVVARNRPRKNTEATLQAVAKLLKAHWAHVVAEARKETPSANVMSWAQNDAERAGVLWVKLRLMEAFPTSFQDINDPPYNKLSGIYLGLNPLIPPDREKYRATYKSTLNRNPAMLGNNKVITQSSACLVLALSQNRGGNVLDLAFLQSGAGDSDGDGLTEILDGWSNPITFIRFPAPPPATNTDEFQKLNPSFAAAPSPSSPRTFYFCDPLDPNGALMRSTWNPSVATNTNRDLFENVLCHKIVAYPALAGPPAYPSRAYYIEPVLVSPGPDTTKLSYKLGLDAKTMDGMTSPDAKDNIYSFRLKME